MRTSRAIGRESAASPREAQRREPVAKPPTVEHVLALQRRAGNAAVNRLLGAGHDRTVRRLQRDDKEREAERAYYESTRQVRLEGAAEVNDAWWRANLSGGDASQIDAFWRGGRKAALIQAISTPDHGLGKRQVLRIWTLYWADKYNLVNNFVDNMGGCARHVPDDKCSEYQRQYSQAAAMVSAVVDVHHILSAAEQHKKSLTLDQINEYASDALRLRGIMVLVAGVAGGLRQSFRAPPRSRAASQGFGGGKSKTGDEPVTRAAPPRATARDEPATTATTASPMKQLPAKSASDRPAPASADPVAKQEGVVVRRQEKVSDATRAVREAHRRVEQSERAVATGRQRYADARAEAERAQKATEQAQARAEGAKRGSDPAKQATQARNDAKKAASAEARAIRSLDKAEGELRDARKAQAKATLRAKTARNDLKRSRAELERKRAGDSTWEPPLKVVRDPRTVTGPAGGKLTDRGYEGRLADDPPLGMQRNKLFDQNDSNLQRMLDGRPPIGRDGEPLNLHHRTRGPMSRLDEYSATEHRQLRLHEAGLDSQIDRTLFGEQRARYWVTRARSLLNLK
ncbi:HNH/ENDO VII family nuclease [Geodermatophilus sp. CPCC 205506]|uniref:HNH/ENDO VII family nuclease n=1 Tax=Geodermatophilus sp. CPCC 205506 TaxID=2936596 RepID=UPI003EEB5658